MKSKEKASHVNEDVLLLPRLTTYYLLPYLLQTNAKMILILLVIPRLQCCCDVCRS